MKRQWVMKVGQRVCVCVCVCVWKCTCAFIGVCICVCICSHECLNVFPCMHVHVFVYLLLCVCVCVFVCVSFCLSSAADLHQTDLFSSHTVTPSKALTHTVSGLMVRRCWSSAADVFKSYESLVSPAVWSLINDKEICPDFCSSPLLQAGGSRLH